MSHAFADAAAELDLLLSHAHVKVSDLVAGGGGEATFTQSLRKSLSDEGWKKHEFVVSKNVDGVELTSQSHEIDHVKKFDKGTIALEIEWNNKDTFYDRDLENFARLHSDGAIALGIIVTRGASLQESFRDLTRRYAERSGINDLEALSAHLETLDRALTPRQRRTMENDVRTSGLPFPEVWSRRFVQDKFGQATTHWAKLQVRLSRGVGNPCPLVCIGIPVTMVVEDRPA